MKRWLAGFIPCFLTVLFIFDSPPRFSHWSRRGLIVKPIMIEPQLQVYNTSREYNQRLRNLLEDFRRSHYETSPDGRPYLIWKGESASIENETQETLFGKWTSQHNRTMKSTSPEVIIYETYYGAYANRLYGLLSSLMMAILLNKAFLVKDWWQVGIHTNIPLDNWDMMGPKWRENVTLEVSNVAYKTRELYELDFDCYHDPLKLRPFEITSNIESIFPYTSYRVKTSCAIFMYLGRNPSHWDRFHELGLLRNQNLVLKALEYGISDAERFERVNQVAFHVAGQLLRVAWKPKPPLEALIERIAAEFKGYRVIGLHIRTGNVTRRNEAYLENKDIPRFFECAMQLGRSSEVNTKWFIATDNEEIKLRAKFIHGDRIIMVPMAPLHTDIRDSEESYLVAMADNELLSRCDAIVVTGGSTFGYIASLKSLNLPYYVNGFVNQSACLPMNFSSLPRRARFKGASIF